MDHTKDLNDCVSDEILLNSIEVLLAALFMLRKSRTQNEFTFEKSK